MAKSDPKDNFLSTDHLNKDIRRKSLKGGAISLATKFVQFVLRIGSTMILARLLTPEDYGMIAMVVVVTGFAEIFGNFGLSAATVQRKNLTDSQLSTCFWLNVSFGVVLTGIAVVAAPGVAIFYDTPELTGVMSVLAIKFLLAGFTVQHFAILTRQMKFKALSVIKMVATLTTITVAIVMAYMGYRYWALVWSTLAGTSVKVIGLWLAVRWLPGAFKWDSEVRSMINFGTNFAISMICDYFSRNMDNVLIGRSFGSEVLGIYSRAYHLLALVNKNIRAPLTSVATPALSRLQHKPDRYRQYCRRFSSILAFITMPIAVLMFVCADDIISVIMGSQWLAAVPIFRVFTIVSLIQSVGAIRGLVMISYGKSARLRTWAVINSILTITSFFIGIRWGAIGVAISFTVMTYVTLYPSLFYCLKGTPFRVSDFTQAVLGPVISSVFMGIVAFLLQPLTTGLHDFLAFVLTLVVGTLIYLCFFAIRKSGRDDLLDYFSYFRVVVGK